MKVELELDKLIRLGEQALLGELINGLIHNLNSPLQNLGMDIELMSFSLTQKKLEKNDLSDEVTTRLKRMENAFENIIKIIKSVSLRANPDDFHELMDLTEFLNYEFILMDADLYFKHQVTKEIIVEKDLELISNLPKEIIPGLSWFIHCLVTEIGRHKLTFLKLHAFRYVEKTKVSIALEKNVFSERFADWFKKDISSVKKITIEDRDIFSVLSLALLKQGGADITTYIDEKLSLIIIDIAI